MTRREGLGSVLVQAVKRNLDRFPEDFMYQLDNQDVAALKSQSVISKPGRGGRRTAPYVLSNGMLKNHHGHGRDDLYRRNNKVF